MLTKKDLTELEGELKNKSFLVDKKKIIKDLKRLLLASVEDTKKVGIAFSGGIDSSLLALLCNKLSIDFKLYSVGFENSVDLEWADKISSEMGWKIKNRVLSFRDAKKTVKKIVKTLKTDNIVDICVGGIFYNVLKMARKEKIKFVLSGLGSDEIFAGYQRHEKNINDCWKDLKKVLDKDIERDEVLARKFNIKILYPFLNKELVEYSMKIDPLLKLNNGFKKVILRESLIELGFPERFAWRRKKAAQYGSRFDKVIEKLSKKSGFKFKDEYLKDLNIKINRGKIL